MKAIKLNSATTTLALIFASLVSATQVLAIELSDNDPEAVSWYQIEVILFKNTQQFEQDKERTTIKMAPLDQKFVLVKGDPMVDSQLQRLDTSNLKLTKSFKAMTRSKNYTVLEFAGWKQPLIKEQPGTPLLITSGQKYGQHHELEGQLTFRKNRYLHLHADLYMADYKQGSSINLQSWLLEEDNIATRITELHESGNDQTLEPEATNSIIVEGIVNSLDKTEQPQQEGSDLSDTTASSEASLTEQSVATYIASNIAHMNETRRMRSGEIHYLDHPKFGLLVTIEPTDPPFVYNEDTQNPN